VKPAPCFYSSPLSRFCAENLPGDFHYLDGDEVLFRHSAQPVVYARETGTLRVLESKLPGETIRRSQREVLPFLAAAIQLAVKAGLLSIRSGVFVIEGRPPYEDGALVSRVRPAQHLIDWQSIGVQLERSVQMTSPQFELFMRCRGMA
jgi:hypothetical protein